MEVKCSNGTTTWWGGGSKEKIGTKNKTKLKREVVIQLFASIFLILVQHVNTSTIFIHLLHHQQMHKNAQGNLYKTFMVAPEASRK